MSKRIDRSWLVFVSIENPEHDRCVDFFSRPDGSYGFEEFRRDVEDGGQWTPVQYYSGVLYASPAEMLDTAERCVPWLADILTQQPHLKARILGRHSPDHQMSSTVTPATHRANFAIGTETAAKRVVDLLTESFFEGQAAIAAFERPDGLWDVTAHFADPPDQALVRELVVNAAGDDAAQTIVFDTVEAKDWVKASLEDLVPVPAGRFMVHGAHDRPRVPPNKLGIEIEAALAFGTGHHGTTRGCLLLLDHLLKQYYPRRVLDLGTGTGVLAIAAAKALHRAVLASDIDPASVRVARENARLNRTGGLVRIITATGFSAPQFATRGPFDLVLANILANPLRQLATPMARHLAPGALVILSGLLTPQAAGVIAAYRARGLVPVRHLRIEGWSSLLLRNAG